MWVVTCPYCDHAADVDDQVVEFVCPECGEWFDVEWPDDEDEE